MEVIIRRDGHNYWAGHPIEELEGGWTTPSHPSRETQGASKAVWSVTAPAHRGLGLMSVRYHQQLTSFSCLIMGCQTVYGPLLSLCSSLSFLLAATLKCYLSKILIQKASLSVPLTLPSF